MIDRPPALSHCPCGLGPATGFLFRLVGVIACATALFSLTASVASTQTAPAAKVQKVTALYGARSGASWPMWMAKDGNYYRKHGLEVELVFGVHPAPIAAVISGQAAMTLRARTLHCCRHPKILLWCSWEAT